MGIKDLFITPFFLLLFTVLAYMIRPAVTNAQTRRFFLPALWVKFFGAIFLGLIYQFYYDGGDTFNYFTHGSRWIWEAFLDSPVTGFKLLTESGGERQGETFQYSQHIWYYRDPHSFFVVRIVAFIDLFTFHTYGATALCLAVFSFSGMWAFYSAVQRMYPESGKWLAIAILFVPSVAFWGSGILKDTITLGALGWLTWAMIAMIEFKKRSWKVWLIALTALWLIYSIKIYIVICFVPMVFVWIYLKQVREVRNPLIRFTIAPVLLIIFAAMGYLALQQIAGESEKYSLDAIAERAAITAYDIRYGWGARTGGEGGYDLGDLDGSWESMIRLMPQAINVSLFRPYPWEVRNPLMLLAALESLVVFFLSFYLLVYKKRLINVFRDPFLTFCFLFALLFAFAVGVSTYNFGTLMRYKIPMMGFYLINLVSSYLTKKK